MVMANVAVQKRENGSSQSVARSEWDPFRLMRQVFSWDPFRDMTSMLSGSRYAPAFNIKETKDSFIYKADVPGIKEEDIQVNVSGNQLTISGEREAEKRDEGETFYAYERSYGSFSRTFTLPVQADTAHVKAELDNGELTLVVPKAEAEKPKRVPVGSRHKRRA
jgi:HSP20 family protein